MGDVLIGEITQYTVLRIIKIEPQKAKINPDRFSRSVGGALFDKLQFMILHG